ncbi:MAG: putative membrane protein [Cryomorphaceae bacterium]|jgi:putative membrane protein
MITRRNIHPKIIFIFSWKLLLYASLLSTAVCVCYEILGWKFLSVPFLPIATIGTAVAFYIGFKNNASYDRLWEARKIWGGIVNSSRTFGTWVSNWLNDDGLSDDELQKIKKELIYRHLAYINVLRTQLRKTSVWDGHNYHEISSRATGETLEEMYIKNVKYISENYLNEKEKKELPHKTNKATYLLKEQSAQLTELKRKRLFTEFEHSDIEKMIEAFFNYQGAAERIKTFPFPRQYGFFSQVFVAIFITLLPFGLVSVIAEHSFVWITIPASILISWIFQTMEDVGDSSENPFENGINDVPLNAICRTIEIDLKEMLDEANIPEKLKPVNDVLM